MASWIRSFAVLITGAGAVLACGSTAKTSSSSDEVVDVRPTVAKRQSIANCWLYSMATWSEAMHNRETHEALDLSEAYWTYWHWYDQLIGGPLDYQPGPARVIDPTGSWAIAAEIIARRGWMLEGDFIPEEADMTRSQRQADALVSVQVELARPGGLFSPGTPRDPVVIRRFLDSAWKLRPEIVSQMDAVFGVDGARDFRTAELAPALPIRRASELSIGDALTLDDAIGASPVVDDPTKSIGAYPRTGPHAWRFVSTARYEDTDQKIALNHSIVRNIQKTLHTRRPVVLAWTGNDAHIDANGAFRAAVSNPSAPPPYRHLAVITDYEVDNVPGFGTLPAGVDESRPEALNAALSKEATVKFFRVKNPWWGSYPKDGVLVPFVQGATGYHDLYMDYLNGEDLEWRRLRGVVLPPEMFGVAPAADAGAPPP